MSGIVGIVNTDGRPVDRALLERMTGFMTYRGPDAQQLWIDGSVGFGHTMLRTTRESANEHQPFTLDGCVWIAADARIDGRADLVGALGEDRADCPDATTDVELILRSYRKWDVRCVEHLLGDFAFAIWDGERQRLFCARDHLGVKPFFYARRGETFVFGNTLDCLRLHPDVSDRIDDVAIGDFLLFGWNQDPATTTFADIRRLPGAHRLTLSKGRIAASRYWSMPTGGDIRFRRPGDYVEQFRALLRTAVDDRLRTERVSCEMSGGLDSTAIAATAREMLVERGQAFRIKAHTVVYDRLIPDRERHYAGLAAEALGLPIDYLVADDHPLFDSVDDAGPREPEPFHVFPHTSVTADFLKRMALHARVALTGWDGDALMCEPPSQYFRWLLRNRRFGRLAGDMAWYVRQKRALPPVGFRTWVKRKLGRYPVRTVYPSWLDPSFAKRAGLRARWEWANEEKGPGHPTHPSAHQMLSVPNWWFLFESYDPGVTGVAIEARHPLTDRRLVEFVLGIPPVPWCVDKHILRVAMAGVLPPPVLGRPKSPLAGDPVLERLRANPAERPEAIAPSERLANYVAADAVPRVAGEAGSDALWLDLRPHCLDRWLEHCALRGHEVERHGRMEPSDTAVPMQWVRTWIGCTSAAEKA